MRRVSVTEIEQWQKCQRKWRYSYSDKIRIPIDSERLFTGAAFSDVMEKALLLEGPDERYTKALDLAFSGAYSKGVVACVKQVPDDVWACPRPVSEDKLEVTYTQEWVGDELLWEAGPRLDTSESIQIVGKPDSWYVNEGEVFGEKWKEVLIDEFKTCADYKSAVGRKLESYERFGVQPIRYGVLLRDRYSWLEGVPLSRRHLLFSSRGARAIGNSIAIPEHMIDVYRQEMLNIAAEIGTTSMGRTWGPLCMYCQFKKLCEGYLTGIDEASILSDIAERIGG